MESSSDIDLEELESRLYSQVFHSTENWDSVTHDRNINNVPSRHVSAYTVSNTPVSGNRYWDAKDNRNLQSKIQIRSNDNVNPREKKSHQHDSHHKPTNTESFNIQNNLDNQNFPVLESIIPFESSEDHLYQHDFYKPKNIESNCVENNLYRQKSPALESITTFESSKVQLHRTKPLKYKSYLIPTCLQLPKAKIKRLPDSIISYFNLKSRESKKKFRMFLRHLEKAQRNNNTEKNESADTISATGSSVEIAITTNGIERSLKLSDIPESGKNESVLPKDEQIKYDYNEIITLSDSDSDSVIEVPLPPLPVYNVDSSSESETEDETTINNISFVAKDLESRKINEDDSENNHVNLISSQSSSKDKIITNEDKIENKIELHGNSIEDCEINSNENVKKNNQIDLNISLTELEKERDDFLHTPDSNINDFLEHDTTLNKNNFCFNFGLHSSDLDLTKDKEESIQKSVTSTNDHDLYETESSCSEIGSVISKTRPVFNEINFESPIKDIFCEPDLSKFSNFITPNRNMRIQSQKNKVRSNIVFTSIQTKACGKNENKDEEIIEENRRRSHSGSSEYHSDPTTLKLKKKNKKAKKKTKKKVKQLDVCTTEITSEVLPTSVTHLEEINSNSGILRSKSLSPAKQIENLKFGSSLNTPTNVEQINLTKEQMHPSPQKSKEESPNSRKRSSPVTAYYIDTYFADDALMLEELEKQKENKIESTVITGNESISVNKETSEKLTNEAQSSKSKTSDGTVNFSFVDTWRKSTDIIFNTDEKNTNKTEDEIIPNKKLKADNSPTVHPYIITLISSDENSDTSEISVGTYQENTSQTVTEDKSNYPDLLIVNVKNDGKPANKKTSHKKNIVVNPFSFVDTYLQNKDKKSFKDFYTNDLNKFYDESWGQENFDVETAQSSMSGNASDWKVNISDIIRTDRRKRGPQCSRCREIGHTQYNCTRFSGPIRCSTCASPGHLYTRCPKSICTTCRNQSNHLTTSCGKCAHYKNIRCTLCNNVGHEMKYCPDLWRRYHLTTESHTELTTSSLVLKSPDKRWCSNCAKRGHCEDKCDKLRNDHFPATPGIISYAPTYDEVFELPDAPVVPNIPIYKNANVTIADLRTIRNNVAQSSNKKYINILKHLRQQCNKYDFRLLDRIDKLSRNVNSQEFSKKKIQEIHKIRARVAKHKIS